MKHQIILTICGTIMVNLAFAQIINWNPDPNGAPWITGPRPIDTISDSTAWYEMSPQALAVPLPAAWDNSQETIYFPDHIDQGFDNSCAQAAGIGHTFA